MYYSFDPLSNIENLVVTPMEIWTALQLPTFCNTDDLAAVILNIM